MVSELDALGDELLLDDDSSYLDEASAAPSIPEGIPSDSKTNKVTVFSDHCNWLEARTAGLRHWTYMEVKSERILLAFLHVLHLQHRVYRFFKPSHSFLGFPSRQYLFQFTSLLYESKQKETWNLWLVIQQWQLLSSSYVHPLYFAEHTLKSHPWSCIHAPLRSTNILDLRLTKSNDPFHDVSRLTGFHLTFCNSVWCCFAAASLHSLQLVASSPALSAAFPCNNTVTLTKWQHAFPCDWLSISN